MKVPRPNDAMTKTSVVGACCHHSPGSSDRGSPRTAIGPDGLPRGVGGYRGRRPQRWLGMTKPLVSVVELSHQERDRRWSAPH